MSDDEIETLTTPGAAAAAATSTPTPTPPTELSSLINETLSNLTGVDINADGEVEDAPTSPTSSSPPKKTITLPSLKRFAGMVAERGAARGLSIVYVAENKRILVELPGPVAPDSHQPHPWVDLVPYYNAFAMVAEDEAGQEELFDSLLELAEAKISPLGSYDDALKPKIVPRLRLASYYELFDLQTELRDDDDVVIPVRHVSTSPGLCAELAVENESTITTVTQTHLRAWDTDIETALDQAIERLTNRTNGEGKWRPVPGAPSGAYLGAFTDGLGAARMLATDIIRTAKVKGDPLVIVPDGEVLLVTGSKDMPGLEACLSLLAGVLSRLPNPILGVWRLTKKNKYVPFEPPKYDENADGNTSSSSSSSAGELPTPTSTYLLYKNIVTRGLGQQYHSQKTLMDKVNEKNEIKVMVATATVMQHPKTGDVLTYCIWQLGTDALLPVTDIVLFCNPENLARPIVGQAPFQTVMDMMGSQVELVPTYPPRYSCPKDVFPTPDQIVSLAGSFEAPEMEDAASKLRTMLDKAQRKREREEFESNLM